MKSAIAEAALAIAQRMASGLVGVSETTVDIGSGSRTTRGAAVWAASTPEVLNILASRCAPFRHIQT